MHEKIARSAILRKFHQKGKILVFFILGDAWDFIKKLMYGWSKKTSCMGGAIPPSPLPMCDMIRGQSKSFYCTYKKSSSLNECCTNCTIRV